MKFRVTVQGEVTIQPDQTAQPEPNDEDRRRARLLAQGGKFDDECEDLFARGIAVARNGGDVEAFLREQFPKR